MTVEQLKAALADVPDSAFVSFRIPVDIAQAVGFPIDPDLELTEIEVHETRSAGGNRLIQEVVLISDPEPGE